MTNGDHLTTTNIRYGSLDNSTDDDDDNDDNDIVDVYIQDNNNSNNRIRSNNNNNDIILNHSTDNDNDKDKLFSIGGEDQLLDMDNDQYSFKDIKFLEEGGGGEGYDEFGGQDGDIYGGGDGNESSKQLPTGVWRLAWFYFCLTSYWFSFSALQSALTSLIWPSQIASIVGDELKEKYLGWMPLFGILIGILWIDSSVYPRYNGIPVWFELGTGAYTGLLPDKVPKSKTGAASGYMAFSNALGNLLGIVGSGVIISYSHTTIDDTSTSSQSSSLASSSSSSSTTAPIVETNYLYVHIFLLVILVLFTVPTIFEMGIYSVLPYFQFYLKDVIGVGEKAPIYTSMLLGVIVITSIPSSIIAGPLSDRYGRKLLVYVSSAIMAVATLMFLILSFKPSLVGVMATAAIFGCGYGAYQAVDYGLALDVLPNQDTVAKDLGVWHQALVVPQVFAPLITGLVLGALKSRGHLLAGYSLVFSITLFWFILATIMIKPIKIYKKEHFIPLDQSSSSIINRIRQIALDQLCVVNWAWYLEETVDRGITKAKVDQNTLSYIERFYSHHVNPNSFTKLMINLGTKVIPQGVAFSLELADQKSYSLFPDLLTASTGLFFQMVNPFLSLACSFSRTVQWSVN
ncbi:hypothetical protein DFA_01719 [Cavenderia fasciculata]|uniref:Major facilitator superfamily (MFS) profile domain-containing protein n=1 Tax=Cavenderia fasciculata TaxID=261658 RepID=F4PUB8_CACFS|nr:uncharacterized protein DFA_01719 [Cavenderia fasciculata]EGG21833.1 hypothetical protein DFA_01719 [Cavenderia fasciculata]|eukprot:XP_004359683.1 hypothetical protein DFA_01719 [Cavenderia fasciculata]